MGALGNDQDGECLFGCQLHLRWCCSHGKKPLASASSSCGVTLPAACMHPASSSAARSATCDGICVLENSLSPVDVALCRAMTGAAAALEIKRSDGLPIVIKADSALGLNDSVKVTG